MKAWEISVWLVALIVGILAIPWVMHGLVDYYQWVNAFFAT